MHSFQRRLDVINLIPKSPKSITSSEIRERLAQYGYYNLCPRTIQRDLVEIEKIGIFGVEADETTKPYRWSVNSSWRHLSLSFMDANTAIAFATLKRVSSSLLPDHINEELVAYFEQADNILQNESKHALEDWLNSVAFLNDHQPIIPPKIDGTVLRELKKAVFDKKKISCEIQRQLDLNNVAMWKTYDQVNPLGLVWQGQVPFFVCTYGQLDKSYYLVPVTRVRNIVHTDELCFVPKSFDINLIKLKKRNNKSYLNKEIKLVLKARKDSSFVLYDAQLSKEQTITANKDSLYVTITATVIDTPEFRKLVKSFGSSLEVLEPEYLRKHLKSYYKELAAIYENEHH